MPRNARVLGSLASVSAICLLASLARGEVTFHVGKSGNDVNDGSASKPFATLERARQAIRQAPSTQQRVVEVHAGVYELAATFKFDQNDSGIADRPVVWRAAEGARVDIIGGRSVPAEAFSPATNSELLSRLDATARGHVLQVDLKRFGLTNIAQLPVSYHGAPPGPELFCNNVRMKLARWPNVGWTNIARIIEAGSCPRDGDLSGRPGIFEYAGDRPTRWDTKSGIWLQGYWCFDWYDEVIKVAAIDLSKRRITLAAPHLYSLRQGNPSPRRFAALNLLEELDEPGEFYIDRAESILFFWPPGTLSGARITLSCLEDPIISFQNVSNLTFRGFTIKAGLGNGIEVTGGSAVRIEACDIQGMRQQGVRIVGGTKHRIEACDIHDTGTGGLVLEGGDRKTLTAAGHEAVNNHIWRFSVHQLTSAYGLSFGGVGNRAAHNLIHDAPHQAVFVGGNDHVFEFNEVYDVCLETDDCGALYKGRNPSCRGNLIRFNYWHDIGSAMGHGNAAIYFDDGDGGDTVLGNIFYRCGDPGRGSFGTIFSHGGHDIRAENNIFIECKRALGSAPWDENRWRAALKGAEESFFPQKLLQEVDIKKPPYTTRYPELRGFMDPPAGSPRNNHAKLNVLVKCGQPTSGNWQFPADQNFVTDHDPGFVNFDKNDFRLKLDAEVLKQLPAFAPIPFEQIGLKTNGLRWLMRKVIARRDAKEMSD